MILNSSLRTSRKQFGKNEKEKHIYSMKIRAWYQEHKMLQNFPNNGRSEVQNTEKKRAWQCLKEDPYEIKLSICLTVKLRQANNKSKGIRKRARRVLVKKKPLLR
uniref:Eukaryotic initiation factor 4A-1 n=1 Tax=Rhizophora mucronata TaxID=61149 RepID=A0A2P2IL71_RHIMU